MAEATRLRSMAPISSSMASPPYKISNPSIGSEVISGRHTDRQAGD
jgi:hypothetical protein